jgi:predicted transcriptional regulator
MRSSDPAREPTVDDVLGPLGAAVMHAVWQQGDATVASVAAALAEDGTSTSAYTTIMTIMGRLHDRGLLAREKHGRVFVYRATAREADLLDRMSQDALDQLLARYGSTAYRQFAMRLGEVDPDLRRRLLELAGAGEDGS